MVKSIFITFLFLCSYLSFGQVIERKVIIENDEYHYVTVDENYQIATLYTGGREIPLNSGKAYALPAGRNTSAEMNPFSWDLDDEEMIAVSFLDHPLNDRNEALKKFKLAELNEWSATVNIEMMVMQSVDKNMFALNQPYLFWGNRSKYLNNFYFDGVQFNDDYWMVSTNRGELVIWKYSNEEWEKSELLEFKMDEYFDLVVLNDKLYMIDDKSNFYEVGLRGIKKTTISLKNKLSSVVLIEDRDKQHLYYIPREKIDFKKTIDELLTGTAVRVE